jgi:hypothetical protein
MFAAHKDAVILHHVFRNHYDIQGLGKAAL